MDGSWQHSSVGRPSKVLYSSAEFRYCGCCIRLSGFTSDIAGFHVRRLQLTRTTSSIYHRALIGK